MSHYFHPGWLFVFLAFGGSPVHAGIEARLDQSIVVVNVGSPTVLKVTLRNSGPATVYMTGIEFSLSEGVVATLYEPTPLKDGLRKLGPGETWGGPLVVVRPNHHGPLLVKGSIQLKGGEKPGATDALAAIPVYLTLNDPRRKVDGSYDPEAVPVCDRSDQPCCDPDEPRCFHVQDRCVYVAEGHDHQTVCVDRQADKAYEKIFELRVSSDAAHLAYLAATQCRTGGLEERCQRTIVVDHKEQPSSGTPTHLRLSPDGRHYAYLERTQCVWIAGQEQCTGPSQPIVDGSIVDALPAWQ